MMLKLTQKLVIVIAFGVLSNAVAENQHQNQSLDGVSGEENADNTVQNIVVRNSTTQEKPADNDDDDDASNSGQQLFMNENAVKKDALNVALHDIVPISNRPKPINLWGDTAFKTPYRPRLDEYNPDDLEALQDKLVDETLHGVSSLITNAEPIDDFDSFEFPVEPITTTESVSMPDTDHIFKVPKTRKTKKIEQNKSPMAIPQTGGKYDYRHYSNFHLFVNLYDHHLWDAERIDKNVTERCARDMNAYLNQLRSGNELALKATDSSGRYGGQYFFGNDFWMGSKVFCEEVNYQSKMAKLQDKLPKMGFFVAKVLVAIEPYVVQSKLLQLGQCLPHSCEVEDVSWILQQDPAALVLAQVNYKTTLDIFNIRRVPGKYNPLKDKKFNIFLSISAAVITLIILATIYESFLLGRGYDLTERRRSSRVKKTDIDQIKKTGFVVDGKNMEMYRIGHENNNVQQKEPMDQIEKSTTNMTIFSRLLICFGLKENVKVILSVDPIQGDALTFVHGLRLFSLLWTVMVHTYLQLFAVGENRFGRKLAERTIGYQIIGNATFSVDTFFFISGLLIVYLYYKGSYTNTGEKRERRKLGNPIQETTLAIIYRYTRLTPAYFFVLVANELALRWTYDRSVFQPGIIDHITCNKFWYRNIFYVNNWFPFNEMCMIWSWYLANDMQFYIMAIILLVLSKRYFKTSAFTLLLILFTSWVVAIFVSVHFRYVHKVADPFESFDILYDKPWQRIGPYIVGMITGYIIVRNKKAPKISNLLNLFLWTVSIAIFFALIFGVWNGELSVPATAVYVSLGHTAWGIGLVWICLSCYWGLASPVNSLLSYRAFYPLSRLTYCAYLIHPVIMMVTSFQLEAPIHLQHVIILTTFLGNAVLSFIVSLIISLMFEAPVIRLLKIVFRR